VLLTKEKKQGLSAFDFFAIGFGAIIGVGWAVSINSWMANAGGPIPAAVGYLLSLLFMIPIALAYAEMTPALPVAGGAVAFAYRAFGRKMAFLSGWAAVGAFITIIPWEAIYINKILSVLFPAITAGEPAYTLLNTPIYTTGIMVGVLMSLVIVFINWVGIQSAALLQKIMVIILLASGILTIIAAFISYDSQHLQPIYEHQADHGSHSNFMLGAISVFALSPFFLAGFETIPQGIEDAAGDVKQVGKTVVLAVGAATIFYAILLFSIGGAMPWKEFFVLEPPAASHLFQVIYPGTIGDILWISTLVGALAGLITTWNGFMLATPLLMMGLARAYLIPHSWSKTNKAGVPIIPLIICGALSALGPVLGTGIIDPFTMFSAAAFVLSWFITMLSLVKLRTKEPELHRPYKVPTLAIPIFGIIICAVILPLYLIPKSPVYIGTIGVALWAGWMFVGLILYWITMGTRKRVPEAEQVASLYRSMSNVATTE